MKFCRHQSPRAWRSKPACGKAGIVTSARKGDVICLDRFGASAPGDVAMKNLGFNVENVLTHARALL